MPRSYFKRPGLWVVTLVLVAVSALIFLRVRQASTAPEVVPTVEQIRGDRGIPVTVAVVEESRFEVWREFSGDVGGIRDAVVRARTGDQISAVAVSVGQPVRQGQVLVRQTGDVAEARTRQAEAASRQAQRTVDRMRPLHEAGAISDQEWEAALTQLELAQQDLAAAGGSLTLTSPLAGVVTEVIARPGMIPDSGDPLVRVADLSRLLVRLPVSASQAAEIREGQAARLVSGQAEGRVRRIALQADPATRLVDVEVEFPRAAPLILGTLATVEVRVASREAAIQVPRAALRDGNVWIVDDEARVTRRSVVTGLRAADRIEITSGVSPGERVVVEGASLLSEGARVRVVGDRDAAGAVN